MSRMKKYKPTTPSRRFRVNVSKKDLYQGRPEKSLIEPLNRSFGRNNKGRITSARKKRGNRNLYRKIDFRRDKFDIPGKVSRIEYDPNRTAFIALINYADGEKRYMLATDDMQPGDEVITSEKTEVKSGNTMRLSNIPVGVQIHNIEINPGQGGRIVRSAGSHAILAGKEARYNVVKLPSGESRKLLGDCLATIGKISNKSHSNEIIGKAGKSSWLGRRPHTRGTAKNSIDHPHGGETDGGRIPVSPWGWTTRGKKTRSRRKYSNKYIVRNRK